MTRRTRKPPPTAYVEGRDFTRIVPIADEDDDTRPVWRYRKPDGVWILLPGNLDDLCRHLAHYWQGRAGVPVGIVVDLDRDLRPTGHCAVQSARTGKKFGEFQIERIPVRAAA